MKGQTTVVQFNFENASAYPVAASSTASSITGSCTSSETYATFGGTNTGTGAFVADNSSSPNGLGMSNSSGTNTRYFQFQLGGSNLSCYTCYKVYFQAQRSSTGATTITLQYSTNGSSWTSFGTATVGTSYTECSFDLCSVTALDNQSAVYFRLYASGASGSGTLRIDNFQVQAKSIITGNTSVSSYTLNCASATTTISYTAQCANSGNVYTVLLSDASGNFSSSTTVGSFTSTATTGTITVTLPASIPTGTNYELQVNSSNPASSGSPSASFSITNTCVTCPSLTGAILDACNSGCNEGDGEVMLFNMGTYSVSVPSLSSGMVSYYGSTANYNSGTVNASTGAFSANATTTSALNSSTGCSGGFIDATSAGSIPAGATVMMVPSSFCYTNYNFSNLCSTYSPIYVLYYGTGSWNSSGNLSNHQGTNPSIKYLTVDWSSVDPNCATQYYNFDAFSEVNGDGAAVSFPGSISNGSSTQVSPNNYTSASCTLPIVLPIELLAFRAEYLGNSLARIVFTTATEQNVKRFVLYRSYDGLEFDRIAYIQPANRNKFTEHKENDRFKAGTDKVYYRLMEEDVNGDVRIAGNCVLRIEDREPVLIWQTEEGVNLSFSLPLETVQVYTPEGKKCLELTHLELPANILIPSVDLPKGLYFVYLVDAEGNTVIRKLVR